MTVGVGEFVGVSVGEAAGSSMKARPRVCVAGTVAEANSDQALVSPEALTA